jgi:predicted permease
MLRDLRHAARMLLQNKGWTAVVVLSLALGIGANTTLFSAVNGLLLQTVPVWQPEGLVRLKWAGPNDMVTSSSDYGYSEKNAAGQDVRSTFSYAAFQQFRSSNQTLMNMFACAPTGRVNVVVNGEAELASAFVASGNYLGVLGVPALVGRTITPEDDQARAPPVAMISHGYWVRRFGTDSNVVGKVVNVNNTPVTIIGVTPSEFTGVQRLNDSAPDIQLPLSLDHQINIGPPGRTASSGPQNAPPPRLSQPTYWWLQIMGRLKPGSTPQQVHGNLAGVFQQTAREGLASYLAGLPPQQRSASQNQNRRAVPKLQVSPGSRGVYDADPNATRLVTILTVVVTLVLLIVCANVANLLLSRASARQKEISVRLSVGASRVRLIRQLLTESLLLSVIGGMLGMLVGYWSRQLLPFGQTSPFDWRVFAFVTALSFMTGIAFGLVPALRATRVVLSASLKESSRSVSGSRTILSKSLLVLQVAVSLVLLIGAGLFLRTLQNLRNVEVGFNTQNLLLFSVNPQLNRYDEQRIAILYEQMKEGLHAVLGVRSVSLSRTALLAGSISTSGVHIQGRESGARGNNTHMMTVSPEFFETMEIPVLAGRGFSARDSRNAPKVAMINETGARRYFPEGNPLGRRFGFSPEESGEFEIVGILRDTKYSSVRDAPPPTVYLPQLQGPLGGATFELRTAGDASRMIPAVREAVRRIDPSLPLTNFSTQAEQVERRFAQERLFALACSLFGGLALLIASIGLFGLMSYNVVRRTNEIGIRMALGAQRWDVIRMVLRESLALVVIGVALGLGTALAASRLIRTLLFGLAPNDALTIASAIFLMILVSTVAASLPARRASRVDPMVALHYE